MISATDLKVFKAEVNNSSSSNGGRMGIVEAASGVSDAYFPVANNAERVAGRVWYSKRFLAVHSDNNEGMDNCLVFLGKPTPNDDKIQFFAATQTDTQAAITGSEAKYGAGLLSVEALATDTSISVNVDSGAGAENTFRDGMKIRISDRATFETLTGNESYVTIVGAPGVVGDTLTITFTPALEVGYAINSKVSGLMEAGTAKANVTGFSLSSAAGTYNIATYPIVLNNKGTIEDAITLTFTSPVAFNITSQVKGSLGAGNIGAGAAPSNPNFSEMYWAIDAAGFGGTFQSGDIISFSTHPASIPIWVKQTIPPNCNSLAGNSVDLVFTGEVVG